MLNTLYCSTQDGLLIYTTPTFRIETGLKESLRTAAQQEHRSIANMVAVLVMGYCERNDIAILQKDSWFDEARQQPVEANAGKREKKA